MASNKARAYFALVGYHFDPSQVTQILGLQPTSTDDSGARGSLDKPVISSWELSTETVTSDEAQVDCYDLTDIILKQIEPVKDKILEACKNLNLSPRIGLVLTLSIDKDESSPEVGFGARLIKLCAEIGAFVNVDYELSERI